MTPPPSGNSKLFGPPLLVTQNFFGPPPFCPAPPPPKYLWTLPSRKFLVLTHTSFTYYTLVCGQEVHMVQDKRDCTWYMALINTTANKSLILYKKVSVSKTIFYVYLDYYIEPQMLQDIDSFHPFPAKR